LTYDFGTGEGERACSCGDLPVLPEELDVFCAHRRFDFLTDDGREPVHAPICEL